MYSARTHRVGYSSSFVLTWLLAVEASCTFSLFNLYSHGWDSNFKICTYLHGWSVLSSHAHVGHVFPLDKSVA